MKTGPIFVLITAMLSGCTDARHYAQATCILVDVSGTYADQRPDVVRIIQSGLLPKARPGDSVVLMRIDGDSYEKGNIETSVTFDTQPSHANAQKLSFAKGLDAFAQSEVKSRYTDISGALMLCGEYLKETGAGKRTVVIFSDMKEELPKGVRRKLSADELAGARVVAMNVKRLERDNQDPQGYRRRLDDWQAKITAAGATEWKVILEPERLIEYVDEAL